MTNQLSQQNLSETIKGSYIAVVDGKETKIETTVQAFEGQSPREVLAVNTYFRHSGEIITPGDFLAWKRFDVMTAGEAEIRNIQVDA